jgi:hypothetical protein
VAIVLIERVRSKNGKGVQVSAVKDCVCSFKKWVIKGACEGRTKKMEEKIYHFWETL